MLRVGEKGPQGETIGLELSGFCCRPTNYTSETGPGNQGNISNANNANTARVIGQMKEVTVGEWPCNRWRQTGNRSLPLNVLERRASFQQPQLIILGYVPTNTLPPKVKCLSSRGTSPPRLPVRQESGSERLMHGQSD